MSKRYEAHHGSASGHGGFFSATVLDTHRTRIDHPYTPPAVCECEDMEDAVKIAEALNAAEDRAQLQARLQGDMKATEQS